MQLTQLSACITSRHQAFMTAESRNSDEKTKITLIYSQKLALMK